MGGICSKKPIPEPDGDEGMTSGLTERDKKLIRQSFLHISMFPEVMILNGIEIFQRMFEKYPASKAYFRRFSALSRKQLIRNNDMKAHAYAVMSYLHLIVNSIHDNRLLIALLEKLARMHKRIGVSRTAFRGFYPAFIDLNYSVNKDFSKEHEDAWLKLFEIMDNVFERLATADPE